MQITVEKTDVFSPILKTNRLWRHIIWSNTIQSNPMMQWFLSSTYLLIFSYSNLKREFKKWIIIKDLSLSSIQVEVQVKGIGHAVQVVPHTHNQILISSSNLQTNSFLKLRLRKSKGVAGWDTEKRLMCVIYYFPGHGT